MFIGTIEVDERWIGEWVAFGLDAFTKYLAAQASFAAWSEHPAWNQQLQGGE